MPFLLRLVNPREIKSLTKKDQRVLISKHLLIKSLFITSTDHQFLKPKTKTCLILKYNKHDSRFHWQFQSHLEWLYSRLGQLSSNEQTQAPGWACVCVTETDRDRQGQGERKRGGGGDGWFFFSMRRERLVFITMNTAKHIPNMLWMLPTSKLHAYYKGQGYQEASVPVPLRTGSMISSMR